MALVRWVTEMGMGVDVHGHDYTKAARRAVSDALRHSSLNFFGAADKTRDDMHVEVIVAVRAVAGGLNVPPVEGTTDGVVIANAAILVSFPIRNPTRT